MQAHEILGVERNADLATVEKAYRKRATLVHPDAGGSKEEFVALRNAYEAMVCCIQTGSHPEIQSSSEASNDEYKSQSFEDFKRQVQRQPFHDFVGPSDARNPLPRSVAEFIAASVLTPIFASAFAVSLCYDGETLDAAVWSFCFSISIVFLVYIGGLVAALGGSFRTDYLTVYRRTIVLVSVLPMFIAGSIAIDWVRPQQGSEARREPVISRDHVPSWWPMRKMREKASQADVEHDVSGLA